MVVYPLLILQPLLSVHNPVRLKFLYLVGIDAKSLIVINYSGHCTKMALELNWIISMSVSGIVAIVGILFIVNILTRRSGPKDRKTNGWVC